MIPNMYKIAGELMPTVFHVSARAVAAMPFRSSEITPMSMRFVKQDFPCWLPPLCRRSWTWLSCAPLQRAPEPSFLHFFDGFRTSMEIQKIELIDYADMLSSSTTSPR